LPGIDQFDEPMGFEKLEMLVRDTTEIGLCAEGARTCAVEVLEPSDVMLLFIADALLEGRLSFLALCTCPTV